MSNIPYGRRFPAGCCRVFNETYGAAGFREVRGESVGESQIPELQEIEGHGQVIGEEWNRKESLVVEGKKPGHRRL